MELLHAGPQALSSIFGSNQVYWCAWPHPVDPPDPPLRALDMHLLSILHSGICNLCTPTESLFFFFSSPTPLALPSHSVVAQLSISLSCCWTCSRYVWGSWYGGSRTGAASLVSIECSVTLVEHRYTWKACQLGSSTPPFEPLTESSPLWVPPLCHCPMLAHHPLIPLLSLGPGTLYWWVHATSVACWRGRFGDVSSRPSYLLCSR